MKMMLGLAAVASGLVTCRCSGADADFDLLRKRKNPDMDARGWHEKLPNSREDGRSARNQRIPAN
ncbi:hypothetical protein Esi_0399_0024 [Ectocarpus siliculosus]|uniref:Uncharacterized protein n=1 Tax=Ectocarpus siliculosus TaxID=2880 RepID=D7G0A5_ECTSI|nr:hypothetical protein Esi_0399_0024 [Ectocarpus siliculosus]|eukprot:CBJ32987.1 hypothetical protein Esi_0399_0024 [Ectocarpus siliculosus]